MNRDDEDLRVPSGFFFNTFMITALLFTLVEVGLIR